MKRKLLALLFSVMTTIEGLSLTAFAEGEAAESTDAAASSAGCGGSYIVMMVILLVVMYFILIRPQKKQEKETKDLQESVQVGDEIVTAGGIVGLVVKANKDNVVIETGGERNKLRIKRWAIRENTTVKEKMEAESAKIDAERKAKKSLKREKKDENKESEKK